jgi:hypothetical protein
MTEPEAAEIISIDLISARNLKPNADPGRYDLALWEESFAAGQGLVKVMPRVQYDMPQVRKVCDLLVSEHPVYGEFKLDHDWGFARKL